MPREFWTHGRKQMNIYWERVFSHALSSSSNHSPQTTLKHLYFTMEVTPGGEHTSCITAYSFKKYLSVFSNKTKWKELGTQRWIIIPSWVSRSCHRGKHKGGASDLVWGWGLELPWNLKGQGCGSSWSKARNTHVLRGKVYKSRHFFRETSSGVLWLEGTDVEEQQEMKLAQERKAEARMSCTKQED